MGNEEVLIIDDEETSQKLLSTCLENAGLRVRIARTGEEGLAEISKCVPSLVVLDLVLPGIDGHALCKQLKSTPATASLPIVMVSSKGAEEDVVSGLELGADDYIPKPVNPKVFVSRVRALLRRSGSSAECGIFQTGDLKVDATSKTVLLKGAPIPVDEIEFSILKILMKERGKVFPNYHLTKAVRDVIEQPVSTRVVEASVVNLRRKLGPVASCLENIVGVGVRFAEL